MNKIHPALTKLARPVADLHPMVGNPRKGDVAAVARSYAQFGQVKPIVVREDGEILAGNHQYAAAVELGWDRIAAVTFTGTEAEGRALSLADNRTSDLGTYDAELLAVLLATVETDADLLAATGYSDADMVVMRQGGGAPGSAEFLAPGEDLYKRQYAVTVTVENEAEQEALFNRLSADGLACRVVTV
jgi:ParB-like chromosome segregation protein Spo0J